MKQPIRVGIVHDYQLFSDVVTALLHQEEEITLIGEAALDLDGGAWEYALTFDVVLIEATMARMNAVHVTREIKRAAPAVQVIVLGVEYREEDVLRFIEAGASGYILKSASYTELLHTIKAVHRGLTLCSPRIAALVFARIAALTREQSQCPRPHQVHLTRRERGVAACGSGHRNGEIAHQLDVALDTVKRHVANICKKFQVHGRRAVIQRAYEHGMLKGAGRAPLASRPLRSEIGSLHREDNTMDERDIRNKIKAAIAKISDIEAADIADTASFKDDLGLDSLVLLEISVEIEMQFGLEVTRRISSSCRRYKMRWSLCSKPWSGTWVVSAMQRSIVITGLGLVTSIGIGREAFGTTC